MHETRDLILSTSFKLFLQKSYKDVTMRELVAKTGLSKGAFYHYFASKEELFIEVVNTFFLTTPYKLYGELVNLSLYDFYHGFNKKMEEFVSFLLSQADCENGEKIEGITYYYMAFDAISRFPDFKAKMAAYHKKESEMWTQVIKNARENGEIEAAISDEYLARVFVNATDGTAVPFILEGKIEELCPEILKLWDAIYEIIRKK